MVSVMSVFEVALVDYEEYTPLYFSGEGSKEDFCKAVTESLLTVLEEFKPMIIEEFKNENIVLKVTYNIKNVDNWEDVLCVIRRLIDELRKNTYIMEKIRVKDKPVELILMCDLGFEDAGLYLKNADMTIYKLISDVYESIRDIDSPILLYYYQDVEEFFNKKFIEEMKERGWKYIKPEFTLYVPTRHWFEFKDGEWHQNTPQEEVADNTLEYWLRRVQNNSNKND